MINDDGLVIRKASSVGDGKVIEIAKNKQLVSKINDYLAANIYKCSIIKQGGVAHPVNAKIKKVLCLPENYKPVMYKGFCKIWLCKSEYSYEREKLPEFLVIKDKKAWFICLNLIVFSTKKYILFVQKWL